jgi:orotidine-5'-phosphate decarboxylase
VASLLQRLSLQLLRGVLPGYLSLAADLKFADVPNVLAAISKVPATRLAAEVVSGRLAMKAINGSLASCQATCLWPLT